MTEHKHEPKTAQPYSDDLREASPRTETKPGPRPDAKDDRKQATDSPKVTQRTE